MSEYYITSYVVSRILKINDYFKLETVTTSDSAETTIELIPCSQLESMTEFEGEQLKELLEKSNSLPVEEERMYFIYNEGQYKLFIFSSEFHEDYAVTLLDDSDTLIDNKTLAAKLFDVALQYMSQKNTNSQKN